MHLRSRIARLVKQLKITIALLLVIVVLEIGGLVWVVWRATRDNLSANPTYPTAVVKTSIPATSTTKLPKVNLQPKLDAWLSKQPGTYGIVIYDLDNDSLMAQSNLHQQFFTASIYKLYVAYLALIDFQNKVHSPPQIFIKSWSRQKCLEEMIRISDSDCGEAMLAEMGKAKVNTRIKALGFEDTSAAAFLTSANDINILLQRLYHNKDLNTDNTKLLLSMMSKQIFRQGLPAGMPAAKVADKVGFYETGWHDVAIVTMPKQHRQVIISYFSKDVSSSQAAALGRVVYGALK